MVIKVKVLPLSEISIGSNSTKPSVSSPTPEDTSDKSSVYIRILSFNVYVPEKSLIIQVKSILKVYLVCAIL